MDTVIEKLDSIKRGDHLILKDFHTLEAMGKETSFTITEVNRWTGNDLSYYGFVIDVNDADETRLMLVVTEVEDPHSHEVHRSAILYRLIQEGMHASAVEDDELLSVWDVERDAEGQLDETFTESFTVCFDRITDEADTYLMKDAYPFWDMRRSDGKTVGICEWQIGDPECSHEWWAYHAFCEWFFNEADSGSGGYYTLYFGWDVTMDDFDFLRQ